MSKLKIDTIAAVSTPAGRSAISLIRVSGPETFKILSKLFKTGGKKAFPLPYSAYFGAIVEPDTGLVADKCLVTTFLAPKSYTGEDLAEVSTHGNPVVVSRVMQLLLKNGARAAEAGEFTRRAFLHGKMDLLEVEAVSQLLSAGTASQARLALNQLDGLPSKFVARIRDRLIHNLVQLEASLNFPEDAVEAIDEHLLAIEIKHILAELHVFARNARNGNLVADGLRIALLGRPNSGKSSLMNYMLGRERAIVTDIAGTTRDTLEEAMMIGDFPVKIIDTAGMRRPGDRIEAMGIERTGQAVDSAFAIVGVFDGSQPVSSEDILVLDRIKSSQKPFILVCNKTDLPQRLEESFFSGCPTVEISSLKASGLPQLVKTLREIISSSGLSELEEMVLLGAQQSVSLDKALAALERADQGIGTMYQDMLAIDLEEAVRELGRVNGETVDVNTLDLIFERFCIGK
ncbi:MAG: tRNA uridine-5-carboxymethylaminomethyl(34) synthesis GTPase MnmE [Candidatus Riflebacteria bacterium]|jgi:tRNA modification GTPase|nr:tRNA uridine-5-carboxymethylaminomethyl(34) synthesis GTPase MnmE [Candidatus Riflebacteria bacterium]